MIDRRQNEHLEHHAERMGGYEGIGGEIVAELVRLYGDKRPLNGPFNHWCEKGLTEYQRAGVVQTQKLYFMYYRKPGMNPREAYNARMLEEYGHEQDEACEAWRQERIALSKRLFPRGQQAAAEKLSDQQGEQL